MVSFKISIRKACHYFLTFFGSTETKPRKKKHIGEEKEQRSRVYSMIFSYLEDPLLLLLAVLVVRSGSQVVLHS